mmetsp:Transcript_41927/g.98328  ORF Transcript_41927/g.98328 Transcript_41927/m.98328 type:complete len:81 (+) Transcript_41927:959-1201(+)
MPRYLAQAVNSNFVTSTPLLRQRFAWAMNSLTVITPFEEDGIPEPAFDGPQEGVAVLLIGSRKFSLRTTFMLPSLSSLTS